ncbi:MAG: hypothetical protein IPM45_11070 [Acidimicrobiales bacterium]|nr:hypothetical protein [Acidimicrobiales bacterium]
MALVMSALVLLAPARAAAQADDAPAGGAAADVAPVDVIEVSGLVDRVLVDFIDRALDAAADDGAQLLVIQLNSKGAVVSDQVMAELAFRISSARVPVGVWVGPSGARALGPAGQLAGYAAFAGMAPGSRLGDLGEPLFPEDVFGPAFGDATDQLRDRTIGASEAERLGVVDVDAPTLGDFIVNLDGERVGDTTLETAAVVQTDDGPRREPVTQVRFYALPLVDQLFHTVASPPVAYLLLTIGLVLIVFEFFTAGIGIAGVTGALALVLGCYGLAALPTRPAAFALLLVSMVAFAIDVQTGVPRFWTFVGTAAYVGASLTLYDGLTLSWITLLAGIGGVLLMMLAGMPAMVRTRFATPTIGREWMVGQLGDAVADVDPDGVVRISDATWPARTNRATPIKAGERVRVVSIEGTVLEVEPEEGGARDHRERRARSAGPGSASDPT